MHSGKPYRAMGVNYYTCFNTLIDQPENRDFVEGFRVLREEYGIPFIRFSGCSYGSKCWKLYTENPEEYFRRFDRIVRAAVPAHHPAAHPSPAAGLPDPPLTARERRHSAGLMRVNHTGEVCAQALYLGQALVARDPSLERFLRDAAAEEQEVRGLEVAMCDAFDLLVELEGLLHHSRQAQ